MKPDHLRRSKTLNSLHQGLILSMRPWEEGLLELKVQIPQDWTFRMSAARPNSGQLLDPGNSVKTASLPGAGETWAESQVGPRPRESQLCGRTEGQEEFLCLACSALLAIPNTQAGDRVVPQEQCDHGVRQTRF